MSEAKRLCAEESEAKVAAIQARDEQDVRLSEEQKKLTSQVKDAEAEVARLQQALSETSDFASQKAAEAEASQANQASVAEREQGSARAAEAEGCCRVAEGYCRPSPRLVPMSRVLERSLNLRELAPSSLTALCIKHEANAVTRTTSS